MCSLGITFGNPASDGDLNDPERKSTLITANIDYRYMRNAHRAVDGGDEDGFGEPAVRVAEAVARAKGVDTLDLDPLFETINSDALNELLANADRDVEVAFEYEGFAVRIRGDGRISLDA